MHDGQPRRRLQAVGVAVYAVLLVSAMMVAFTNASGARLIAVNSDLLQWSNVTSGALSITRAALSQAVIFSVDENLGVSSSEATELAIEEAERTVSGLRALAADTPEGLRGISEEVAALADDAQAALDLLREGDTASGILVLDQQFAAAYANVALTLGEAQAVYAGEIDRAESTASRIENALQWMATLLVPGIAILLYRIILRRRFERRKVEFEASLAAERELNVAKDELIAGISHELRTPLTSILGFSQHLIEHGLSDEEEALELLSMINSDSQELARMVEDLLTAARLESDALAYDLTRVDLAEEARSIAEQLRRTDIEVLTSGGPAAVVADPARARQIVRNLISNAIQHGGERIKVLVRNADAFTACEVIDNGSGVPADIADRLFDRFVHEGRQSLLTGSVGLGLAIAQALATEMGGDVVYTRRNGETSFTLELPTYGQNAPASANGSDRAKPHTVRPTAAIPSNASPSGHHATARAKAK